MRILAACTLGLALMFVAIWHRPDGVDDFRAFYRGASLAAAHESVYAEPSSTPDKTHNGFLPFLRLPSYAAVLEPLASQKYSAARSIWIGLEFLAVGGCIWLLPFRREGFAWALAFSFPLAYSFVLGQDIALVLLIVIAALRLAAAEREFTAGLVASLIGIKISFLPAVGIVFLAKSRRGTLGLVTGLIAQLAVSFAVGGAAWPAEYLAILRNPLLDPEPRRMPGLRAVAASLSLPSAIYVFAAVALLACLWVAARRLSLSAALMLALPIGLLAVPHAYIYDETVLIPLLVSVAGMASWRQILAGIALTPLPGFLLVTNQPAFVLAGSLFTVVSTIAAAAFFYQRETGSLSWDVKYLKKLAPETASCLFPRRASD